MLLNSSKANHKVNTSKNNRKGNIIIKNKSKAIPVTGLGGL
jgi:hypothetical protein